jgi:hypothetical protein
MARKSRVVRSVVAALALGLLTAACGDSSGPAADGSGEAPQRRMARSDGAALEREPQFPADFANCGQSDRIATSGCVIVLNLTRGWVRPGPPTYTGGLVLRAVRREAYTVGGSSRWREGVTEPLLDPRVPSPTVWGGASCRTAWSACRVTTWWTFGAAVAPRPLEEAILLRGGNREFTALQRTRPSGTANQCETADNDWIALSQRRNITRTQNGRCDVEARNYVVWVQVSNLVRDQRLGFVQQNNTTTAVEDPGARLPQTVDEFGQVNGSLVLAPRVGGRPKSGGRGEYGYVTRVSGAVRFDMVFNWLGSPGIEANGNRATVQVNFARSGNKVTDSSTCSVSGSFAPVCRIRVSATDSNAATVTIDFEDR